MARKRKRCDGARLLLSWRTEVCKITQQQAAQLLDLDVAAVCAFETGYKEPGLERARSIEERTGGAVPVAAWTDPRPRGRQVRAA